MVEGKNKKPKIEQKKTEVKEKKESRSRFYWFPVNRNPHIEIYLKVGTREPIIATIEEVNSTRPGVVSDFLWSCGKQKRIREQSKREARIKAEQWAFKQRLAR